MSTTRSGSHFRAMPGPIGNPAAITRLGQHQGISVPSKPTRGGKRPGAGRPPSGRSSITFQLRIETIEVLQSLTEDRIEQAALLDELVKNHAGKKIRKTS